MKIIFILCGVMWIFFGVGFLAVNASVVSAPTHLITLRNVAFIIIGVFFIIGIYFIKTAMNENKKKIHKVCNRSFYKLMIKNNYNTHIRDFAKGMNIRIEDAVEYINSRLGITSGILDFKDNGQIIINKFKIEINSNK